MLIVEEWALWLRFYCFDRRALSGRASCRAVLAFLLLSAVARSFLRVLVSVPVTASLTLDLFPLVLSVVLLWQKCLKTRVSRLVATFRFALVMSTAMVLGAEADAMLICSFRGARWRVPASRPLRTRVMCRGLVWIGMLLIWMARAMFPALQVRSVRWTVGLIRLASGRMSARSLTCFLLVWDILLRLWVS